MNVKVIDHKGLTINYWNRYMKQFQFHINSRKLSQDLNQEIEMIALEAKSYEDIKEAGKIISKGLREFLKKIGLRKKDGYWKETECVMSIRFWKSVYNKAKTPSGINTNNSVVFVGQCKYMSEEHKRKVSEAQYKRWENKKKG